MIITIDGGAASGKSTAAVAVANALHYYYINSGMLYRAVAYLQDIRELSLHAIEQAFEQHKLHYTFENGKAAVIFEQQDITIHLKEVAIEQQASILGQKQEVRELVTRWQHKLADQHDVVAEGRDCGTVVFPQADYKFFFTASLDERVRRWQKEQFKKYGKEISTEDAQKALQQRDERDINRPLSPLQKPTDAIEIDTTYLTRDEVLKTVLDYVK